MIATLALSVVGSWSYAGFLSEPSPNRTPAPEPTPAPASAPIDPAPDFDLEAEENPCPESPTPPTCPPSAPATKPPADPPKAASKPTLYRSTDASGQTWEHPDPAYLSSFIEARNRSFASYSQAMPASYPYASSYTYASPSPYRASRCSTGRCN